MTGGPAILPGTVRSPGQNTVVVETKPMLPRASVLIVNTNELEHLKRCLPSVFGQRYPDYEVFVIDNGSTDESVAYVAREFPQAKIIQNKANLGYTGANNVGFEHASGHYIAVLNPDTRVEPNWLAELVIALEADRGAGLATPKILKMDDPGRINCCGNEITFTGLTFCRGLDRPAAEYDKLEAVSAVSGAGFVIRRSVLEQIGGFDETFFIYYEDTDLSLRAMLAGYTCLYVPTSVIYHKYAFHFTPAKCFFQERNRQFSLLKALRWRTLIALSPALLLSELIAWGYALLNGREHMRSKLRSYIWLIRNRRQVLEARRRVQAMRKVDDRTIIRRFSHRLGFAQTVNPRTATVLERVLNPLVLVMGRIGLAIVNW
jgi:GT2 family glycosyltransferase